MKAGIVYFFMILFVAVFWSCSDDDDYETLKKIDTGKVVAESAIDDSGGVIEADGMRLEIPAGAFSEMHSITLSKLSNNAFGKNQLSDIIFINNLPSNLAQAMNVFIEHPLADENTIPFIVEITFVKSLNKQEFVFHKADYDNTESGCNVVIPSLSNLKSSSIDDVEEFEVGVVLVANMTEIIEEHVNGSTSFNVICEPEYEPEAIQLGNYLDNVLAMLKTKPHYFDFSGRDSWPMTVTIKSLPQGVYGYFEPSMWGANYTSLILNSDLLSNMDEMKITAGHEFIHFYQFLNDPRNFFSKAKLQSPYLWVDEAVAVYYESYFAGDDTYISPVRRGNEHYPYEGGLSKEKSDPQNFGYGMSGMVRYLTRHLKPNIVSETYKHINTGKTVVESIELATDRDYNNWWPFFIQKYTAGEIYSDINSGTIITLAEKKYEMKSDKDSVFSHVAKFDELETVIYTLKLDKLLLNDADNLVVEADGSTTDVSVGVFKMKSSTVEQVATGSNKAYVVDLKSIVSDGFSNFSVVVSNLSRETENREIETILRINPGSGLTVSFTSWLETKTYENDELISTENIGVTYSSPELQFSKNLNVLTSSWSNKLYNTSKYSGNFTIIINDDNTLDISLFDVVETTMGWKITYSMEAAGVQKTSRNAYDSSPGLVLKSFTRKIEMGDNRTIISTGPPFFTHDGSEGYLRIQFN